MAAQDYYQSFQKPPRPNPTSFQNTPPPQPQLFGPGPRRSSGSLATESPYPNPPYPVTPGPVPQQSNPSLPYPVSDLPPKQYLAPPLPNGQAQSYFPPQTELSSSYGPRPSDPYAYPPGAPLTLQRSTSEPPENRRMSLAPPPAHRHHHHHRRDSYDSDASDSSPRSSDRSPSGSRSRSRGPSGRSTSRKNTASSDRSRNDRTTFLGAGGGAIVGDAIFPGLGTLGGLILGGLGGHEYARRRSRSEVPPEAGRKPAHHHHHHHRRDSSSGAKKTYGDGVTVVSEWGLIQR